MVVPFKTAFKQSQKKIQRFLAKQKSAQNDDDVLELFEQSSEERSVGIESMINSGNYGPLPFESQSNNCFTSAVERYFIAKEMRLNPRFFIVYGQQKICSDGSLAIAYGDHSFIDVISKDSPCERICLDYEMNLVGQVSYSSSKKEMHTESGSRAFKYLEELSLAQLIDKIKLFRGKRGALYSFMCGQRTEKSFYFGAFQSSLYLKFDEQDLFFDATIHKNVPFIAKTAITKRHELSDDGRIRDEKIIFSAFSQFGWFSYKSKTVFGEISCNALRTTYNLFDDLIAKKGDNPKRANKTKTSSLTDLLILKDRIYPQELEEAITRSYEIYLVSDAVLSMILVRAIYQKRLDESFQQYLYPKSKRDEDISEYTKEYFKAKITDLVRTEQKIRRELGLEFDDDVLQKRITSLDRINSLEELIRMRRADENLYDSLVDYYLFGKDISKKDLAEEAKKHNIGEEEKFNAYRKLMLESIVIAYQANCALSSPYVEKSVNQVIDGCLDELKLEGKNA